MLNSIPQRQLYAIWPDGSFCELEDVGEYLLFGFSDDFDIAPNNPEEDTDHA